MDPLLGNPFFTIMDEYENIISFENLYKAHRVARLGKRHKKEVVLFEANLSQNLWELHYDLKYGKYRPGGYHRFMIYDPKEREIQAISYRDRIVQHSLCDNFLMPLLERRLICDNVACRKNKGSGYAVSRLREFMARHYKKYKDGGYFVKIDVRKYFDSIDHECLKEQLTRLIRNGRILTLLFLIIDSYCREDGRGLPMGNQTSQCFALLYLDPVDRFIKERLRIKFYLRYMDDMLLIVWEKERAKDALQKITEQIEGRLLKVNPKSAVMAVECGVEFIGWRFSYGKRGKIIQKLRRSTKKRILKKIRFDLTRRWFHPERRANTYASYRGFLLRGDNRRYLKKIKTLLERE